MYALVAWFVIVYFYFYIYQVLNSIPEGALSFWSTHFCLTYRDGEVAFDVNERTANKIVAFMKE